MSAVPYPAPYPARVNARLHEPLSRWLWLVKWILVVPHYVVLAFLWPTFAVLSVVAGVAILPFRLDLGGTESWPEPQDVPA
jgi:hypothetical protein